jgi:hypothetical protein
MLAFGSMGELRSRSSLFTPLGSEDFASLRASSPRETREDESSLLTPLGFASLRASLAASAP